MRGAWAALLLLGLQSAPASAQDVPDRQAFLFLVDGLSYEGALADPAIGSLARAGGIGLMTRLTGSEAEARIRPSPAPGLVVEDIGAGGSRRIVEVLTGAAAGRALVVVAVASPSAEMEARTGTVTPVVVARGDPDVLLSAHGEPGGLTSDTTRREGLVSNVDVAPTILEFLGLPVPEEEAGSPIRVEGEAPTDLHERYVEWRRSAAPAGVAVLAYALASLAAALVLRLGPGGRARRAVAVWVLSSIALLVAMLPVSVLPDLRLPVVLAAMAAIAAVLTAGALGLGRGSPSRPVVLVAAAGLGLVLLDGLLGWPTGLTPLLGGSALEGVRFFGLGNPYAGIVLSGAVLGAAPLGPRTGVAILLGAGLFAGLPFLGADLGGGVAMFAVAALWYALRVRGRLGWAEAALVAVAAAAGLALLVVAHRVLPPGDTHVTRAVAGAGPGDLVGVFLRRLELNVEATSSVPAAWLAVLGLPAWLGVAWWRPGRFRPPLDRVPAWRHAVIALAVGGMIGYVLNDTYGMAAVTFVFLSGAMVVPALRWTNG